MPVEPEPFFRIYRATDVDVVMAFSVETRLVLSVKTAPGVWVGTRLLLSPLGFI